MDFLVPERRPSNKINAKVYLSNGIEKIEEVQRKFLRYASFKIDRPMQFTDHNYSQIS